MVADERYTFMHAEGGFRPMLFDRDADPNELNDHGTSQPEVITKMYARLHAWSRRPSQRTTRSEAGILTKGGHTGMLIGAYDETDVTPENMGKYRDKPLSV